MPRRPVNGRTRQGGPEADESPAAPIDRADGRAGETGGVRIFVAAVGQFLQPNVRAALAEHVGDGIARARAGCLNVVFMAHQGTLPMTVNFLSTGQFVLRPIGSAL